MAGPWEKYQQQPASDQPQTNQAGPWAKYQAPARGEIAANDAPEEQGGIQASDFGKEVAGGALVGTGSVVSGFGDLLTTAGSAIEQGARVVLPDGAVDALKSIPAPSDLLFRPAGRQIESAGKRIQDTKSAAAKQAVEASTPRGDVLDPSSWSMGDNPSLAGYGLQASNLIGQFVPQAAGLAIPGGQARMAGMAGIGGLQAGGAAGNEVEQRLAAMPDAELQHASDLYRELRANGMAEADARAQIAATARAASFQGAAPVGAAGGALTNYALGPLQSRIGGGIGQRLAGGVLLNAPAEGAQEVSETVAARAVTNKAIGEQRDLTEDTFAAAVLGAMGGAGHASLGAVLGRPQSSTRTDAAPNADVGPDATFDSTPEPAALPAPGLQALPSPDQTFYADSQGNVQDVGPVRNVDGEMQPDPQGRQWVNPANDPARMAGGPGMDQQTARGAPAPLVGDFQHGSRQGVAETAALRGQTLEGELQRAALPAPDAIVVDGEGNAKRGATAPQVFERPVPGGRGMDQQAPTATRSARDFEYLNRANGQPFQAHGSARASKAFREAKKAGRNPTIAKVDGGFAVRVPADPQSYQMRPIDRAAHEAATSPNNDLPAPTPAQIEAGNYKKGRVRVQGLEISIENPKGSERSGTDPDGNQWRHTMSDHYGYIKRTKAADGEQLDVYVGPQQDSQQVFIVDQVNQQDGNFDEHKVMLGYPDQATAVEAYRANFDENWKVGAVTAMPVTEFKEWLKEGDLTQPAQNDGLSEKEKPAGYTAYADSFRKAVIDEYVADGVAPDVAERLASKPRFSAPIDATTGLFEGRREGEDGSTDTERAIGRAIDYVAATDGEAYWVSADIANLGGLNAHFNNVARDANRHYRALADIVRKELGKAGQVEGFRTGGDEFGALVIGGERAAIDAALERARQTAAAYTRREGLDKIVHPKHPDDESKRGLGLHLGVAQIAPIGSPSNIMALADKAMDQSKKGNEHVSGIQAGTSDRALRDQRPSGTGEAPERTAGSSRAGASGDGRTPSGEARPAAADRVSNTPSQERAKRKGPRRAIDRDRDSVVQATIRLGGITTQWRQDTTGEPKGNKHIPGVGALWSDNTGTSLDDMASLLDQHGYIPAGEMDRDGGVSWLQEALRDELAGRKMHYAPDSARQLEQYEQEMLDRINEQIAAERDMREAEYARIEAEHGPEAAADARSFDEMAIARSEQLDGALEDAQTEQDTYVDGEPLDESAAARRDDEIRQADEREDRVAREDAGTPFDLEQQTEQGLKEQAERNAAAEKAQAEEARLAEQKAQADRDRNDFTLTGSDRISDVAVARGQNDMFGAQPATPAVTPATPASKAKEQAAKLAKKPAAEKPATEKAPAKKAKPVADKGKPNTQKATIEDAGEKLGGARKDELRTVRERLDDMDDAAIAGSTLSQLWPKDEVDRIQDPFNAAAYYVVRSYIPAKPRVAYKVRRWVEKVKAARDILDTLGKLGADATVAKMREFSPSLNLVADQIELLTAVDRVQWGRIGEVRRATGRYSKDGEMVPGSWVEVKIDGRGASFYGHESVASALPEIKQTLEQKEAPEKKMKFAIYYSKSSGAAYITKDGDKERRQLKSFPDTTAARKYLDDHHDDLVAAWEAVKNRDNVTKADMRRDSNDERVGRDYRNGEDVTPDQFLEAFGFRGVEFGNWVKQGAGGRERQGILNDAYDAFMDLASVVGVPPKALSLDGKLGIGFGSRGRGSASAHYEPGTTVINLTKTKGAGSLAHEWFHALDNYFAGKRDAAEAGTVREGAYITYRPEPMLVNKRDPSQRMTRAKLDMYQANHPGAALYAEENWSPDPSHPKGVRQQVEKAFAELVETLDRSPMAQRAAVLDKGAADGYWSRIIERGARSFETYVIARLADQGARNDYLANVQTLEQFVRDPGRYPYLTPGEQGPVNEAFDKLFSTIETRETDSGVQMYRLEDGAQSSAREIQDALAQLPELASVTVVQSFKDLPAPVRARAERDGVSPGDVRGVFRKNGQYLVADNQSSLEDAIRTAVHEMVGHRGIHGLLGNELNATMERIYSSEMTRATGRQRIEQIREHYAKVLKGKTPEQQRLMIAEEIVAHLAEEGDRPTALQRVASKIRELLRKVFPQVAWTYTDVLALIGQSREWMRRNNDAVEASENEQLYSLRSSRQHTSEAFSDLTAKQKEALGKIAPLTPQQRAIDWFRQQSDRALLKIRQGLVDRFAALRDLDEAAHGKDILSTDITSSSWVLARMSSAASGALHAMLNNGRIFLDQQQKVIDIQPGTAMGLGSTLARLGTAAEIERFMGWIAGNRSAKLAAEGRENLFDAAEIDALRTLNRGTTEGGKDRGALYNEVFTEFQQYRDDVLAIAEQTGIITPENRAMWRDEFYVPFYRVMDDDGPTGPMGSKGLGRQEAYKKLKGGKQNLNDLLQNTLLNFNHLLSASLKNQAAAQAISNAEQLGIAQPVSESARDKKVSTFVLKDGVKQWYNIEDPLVFEALSSLSDAGLNNAAVRAMSFFKRLFTNMTTITPQFIIANLLRDSMSATATSPVSKNFLKNIAVGGKDWTDARKRARMLASGGAFSFGHIYSNDPEEVKAHLTRNLRSAKLIDGPKLVPQALKAGWDAWNAFANTAENTNRAAIFGQNEQDKGKLAAAFEARDLMDFSMHGAWPAVRFLIRVVPFLNARLQGLDKLYRAGVKPSLLTAFGKGDEADKQAAKRFMVVTTALSLASMALMLVNNDDEEYRKLEEWQKDTYWFVRLGGKAFFIPKPFEVGAIATMTERLLQQAIDDKATGKLFAQRLGHTLTQTFSFSPVPHMFQPVLDVYSNVDAFTGRPIESTGMDRLSKGLRARTNTTVVGKAASAATRVFGDEFPLAVSPIQADHLIAGYLGQVGAWGAGMVDTFWRSAKGESQPAKHWHEYQPIRRFYRDLDTPAAYTRYSTLFYEGLREAGQAYADVKELQELGRMEEARKVIGEKRGVLGMRKQLNKAQRRLSAINARMDAVRLSELDADAKRRELDRLLVVKNRLTEVAGKQIEELRAKR